MKIRNVEFDFNPLHARDAERLQQASQYLQAASNAFSQGTEPDGGLCGVLDAFLADVLGEDYAERLDADTDDMEELMLICLDVFEAIHAAKNRMNEMTQRFQALTADSRSTAPGLSAGQTSAAPPPDFAHMNRAQRRAAVRAMKGGKA